MDQWEKYFNDLYTSPGHDPEAEEALRKVERRLGIRAEGKGPARALLFSIPLAAALIIAAMIFSPGRPEWQELTVPDGQISQLQLSDGSVLTLGGGSRITYPSAFSRGERTVFLEGEVLADIAKDESSPFVIRSGDFRVKVHGTSFDFKSYRESESAELFLVHGSVSLDLGNGHEITMRPGDFARYDKESGALSLSHGDDLDFSTISRGRSLYFRNQKMSEIAFELKKVYGTDIVITSPELADKRFLAYFTNGETLDEILSGFNSDGSMKIIRRDGRIFLSYK